MKFAIQNLDVRSTLQKKKQSHTLSTNQQELLQPLGLTAMQQRDVRPKLRLLFQHCNQSNQQEVVKKRIMEQ